MLTRRCLATLCAVLWLPALALAAEPAVRAPDARPEDLGDIGAGEGPAWRGRDGIYFTGRLGIGRRDPAGRVTTIRADAGGANGLVWDPEGRLTVCEAARRRVTRTEVDGAITVLAERYEGHRFNSPNDLTRDSRGRIYFSDPRYGSRDDMEMRDAAGRLIEGVYRIDAPGRVTRVLGAELERPNGVLVSGDDRFLYVADNHNNAKGGARKLWRFDLAADGSVKPESRRLLFDWDRGRGPDGLKQDTLGRLYVAAGLNRANPPFETSTPLSAGVYVLSPEGELRDFIAIPHDEVTNCAFGGDDHRTLFITAGGHLWSLRVNVPGR